MATTGDKLFDEQYFEEDDEEFHEEDFSEEGFNDASLNPNPNASFAPPVPAVSVPVDDRKLVPFDDSRRLFQRLWTEEDEIVILEGFLDFVTKRGTTHNNYQHDTGPFYEQIKSKIQLDFNKNQLTEKLRRLKRKYGTLDSRMKAKGEAFAFRSDREKARFEISEQIWSSVFKRPKKRSNLDGNNGVVGEIRAQSTSISTEDPNLEPKAESCPVQVSSAVEETVKCRLSPLFKELVQHGFGSSLPLSLLSSGLGNLSKRLDGESSGKWKEQQILELEVYSKRMQLLEEQIKAVLEELRSSLEVDG